MKKNKDKKYAMIIIAQSVVTAIMGAILFFAALYMAMMRFG